MLDGFCLPLSGQQAKQIEKKEAPDHRYQESVDHSAVRFVVFRRRSTHRSDTMVNARITTDGGLAERFVKSPDPHRIRRKAIDRPCGLGFLYDANDDRIISQPQINLPSTRNEISYSQCRIYFGQVSTSMIDYLEKILDDQSLFQSLLVDIVQPSGIAGLWNDLTPVDENVRLFHHTYHAYVDRCNLLSESPRSRPKRPNQQIHATHLITDIVYGFEVLCVFRIPDQTSRDEIDAFLHQLSTKLNENPMVDEDWSRHQMNYAHQIDIISLYGSNRYANNCICKFSDLLKTMTEWQKDERYYYPVEYQMLSLRHFFNLPPYLYSGNCFGLNDITSLTIKNISKRVTNDIKYLFQLSLQVPEQLSPPSLSRQADRLKERYEKIIEDYRKFQLCSRIALLQARRNRSFACFHMLLGWQNDYPTLTETSLKTLGDQIKYLIDKIPFIQTLNNDQIEYFHIDDLQVPKNECLTDTQINQALYDRFSEDHSDVFLCHSTDQHLSERRDQWQEIHANWISIRLESPKTTKLFYVDFTFSQHELPEMIPFRYRRKVLPKPEEMNVLIIGETGVGKSTFINAFVNYLAYDTLEEAEEKTTITVLPASFLITTGFQFDEVRVNIGEHDPNEDFSKDGASVTQHCMSYIIPLRHDLHLRLIDTPGMGDTRGIEQDAINIDHILTYLGTLSHLHAVLFVLKPNVSRMNIFFRSCLQQLFTYLTPHAYENIIFAFSSARSTFYAPGDTAPSLRKMLAQNNLEAIPFGKKNVFCFDNEAFRYLAAIRQGLDFDMIEKNEIKKSWTRSVTESIRLLQHIRTREAYALEKWQSVRRAVLEVKMLARPLMDEWRLKVLRTWGHAITAEFQSSNEFLCSECAAQRWVNVGGVRICEYGPGKRDGAEHCRCPDDGKRFLVESIVRYEVQSTVNEDERPECELHLREFSALAQFTKRFDDDASLDPFQVILGRFLNEITTDPSADEASNHVNDRLVQEFRRVQTEWKRMGEERLSLGEVMVKIQSLSEDPQIRRHVDCIKKSRTNQMKIYERQVSMAYIKNENVVNAIQ